MTVPLHHVIDGPTDRPALVLLGSLGTTLDMWRPQLAALTAHYRVIRVDHRGHGGSPVPTGPYRMDDLGADLLALLDTLGEERVRYCGLSLGGMVGMWVAAHAPERISRMVLLCTSAYLPPAGNWLARAAQVRSAGTASIAATAVSRWFTDDFRAADPTRLRYWHDMFAGIPAEGYAGCCESIATMDLRPVLPKITADTLVIAAADDPAIPPEHGAEIVRGIAGSQLSVIGPAGHLANVERPGEVSSLILAQLDE
jgi:3-oxoadipate enol-lactonase